MWLKSMVVVVVMSVLGVFMLPSRPVAAACDIYVATAPVEILVPWYKYLDGYSVDTNGKCRLEVSPNDVKDGKFLVLVLMAIVELLTRVAALIAVGYVIYGAIQYIVSQGEPDGLKRAKDTIANALVGLVIVLLAISIVQFVGRAIQ